MQYGGGLIFKGYFPT